MDALMAKKVLEAKEHVQNAEKSLKTSLFKRTPDFDTAAAEYGKAAIASKIAKQFDKSIEYFQKSADCYIKLKSQFNAAKQFEQVAFICNETKNYAVLFESMNKATDLFLENGTRDSAGILLEKGANMLKLNEPEKALLLYKRAIYIAEVEDKYHEMNTLFENSITISIRLKKLNEAIELIKNRINVLERIQAYDAVKKQILTLVIIYLYKDDWVSATKEVQAIKERYELDNDAKTFNFSDDLLSAYDDKDADRFNLSIRNNLAYCVDNETLKLAQAIPKTGEWNFGMKPKQQTATTIANSYNEAPVKKFEDIVNEDDEEEHHDRNAAQPGRQNDGQDDEDDDLDLL